MLIQPTRHANLAISTQWTLKKIHIITFKHYDTFAGLRYHIVTLQYQDMRPLFCILNDLGYGIV